MANGAVTNFSCGANALSTLPHFAAMQESFSAGEKCFAEASLIQNSKIIQIRERAFIKGLEKKLSLQGKDPSHLKSLLTHLPDSKGNEVHQALFKQDGYFKRLFSHESWQEWTEDRTALGNVVFQLKNCVESNSRIRNFVKKLDREVILEANKQAKALLEKLEHATSTTTQNEISFLSNIQSKSACVNGLIGGTVGSLITKHPFPFFLGLSGCLPVARAQQMIGNEFQVNTYATSEQWFPSVASLSSGNFVVTWASDGQDGSSWGVFGQVFDGAGAKIGSEFQVNTYTTLNQFFPSVECLSQWMKTFHL